MAENYHKGLKTLWEKEKLLVTSNFSFSHSVFKRLVLQTRKNQGLFGKGLIKSRSCNDTMCKVTALFICFLKVIGLPYSRFNFQDKLHAV